MFFRKPMRLEKWIAFDGAVGAEVMEAVSEQSDHADNNDTFDFSFAMPGIAADTENSGGDAGPVDISPITAFSPLGEGQDATNTIKFDVDGDSSYDAKLELPIGMTVPNGHDGSGYLPFGPASGAEVDFDMKSGLNAHEFFIEISKPENGEFFFFTNPNWAGHLSIAAFVYKHGLRNGDFVALQTQSYPDGSIELMMGKVQNAGTGWDSLGHQAPSFRVFKTDTGGLRIGIYSNATGGGVTGEMLVESIFRSLAFRPDSGATDAGSFQISIYYKSGQDLWSDGGSLLNDSGNTVFDPITNPPKGIIEDASKPCDESGAVIGGGSPSNPDPEPPPGPSEPEPEIPGPEDPGPEEPVAPIPETPTPPPEQPTQPPEIPPIIDNGSDNSTGDGDAQSGEAAEADAGGDAVAADGVVYVHRDDGVEEEFEEDEEIEDVLVREEGDSEREDGGAAASAAVESAAAAVGMELMRDAELLAQMVRGDRLALEKALVRLRDSYFGMSAGDKELARAFLRELFESGNKELDAVNRILHQMRVQIDAYQTVAADRRDGMLMESIRELLDSATRRSGETGALSAAMNAVCEFLEGKRADGGRLVDAAEAEGRFSDAYAQAMAEWESVAERNDPMGRELARSATLHK